MNEKKLLTLKQIADEIGVNYKTIHHYRDVFEEFMKIQFAGRRVKYLPENIDLFCKILELKDEGRSNEDIRESLKVPDSDNPKVPKSEGLDICLSDDPSVLISNDLDILPSIRISDAPDVDLSIQRSDPLSDGISDCPTISLSEHLDISLTGDLSDELSETLTEEPSELLSDGHPRELSVASAGEIKADILNEVNQKLDQNLHAFTQSLTQTLQKMATQSNIAITALCEAAEDIRTAVLNLDARLSRLENDLDVEAADPLELYQVEAGNYQVDLPEISMPDILPASPESAGEDQAEAEADDNDDLAPVKASIANGIPDRDLLVQWVQAKREEDVKVYSYRRLADMLTEGGVPTLSGRDAWSGSTVRNLLIRLAAAEQD